MSGIKTPILDIITKLETGSFSQYSRIWNNQFEKLELGTIEAFPFPCAFVEVVLPNEYNALSSGISASDVTFRIHIGQTEYDAQDGRLSENKSIFDLRDEVVKLLTNFYPTACSGMMRVSEEQDYKHTNIYHYVVDFVSHFIDDKGDTTPSGMITKQPPTTLEINPITIVTEITE